MADEKKENQIDKLKKQFARNNGSNNQKTPGGPKKTGFNFYWVYGLVFALFIGMQVFSAMSFRAKTSNFREFEESLQLGDVDRVNILNEKKIQVFIKEDRLTSNERYNER